MNKQQITKRKALLIKQGRFRDPIALTALLYLQEVLLAERFEECGDIIEIARQFGAEQREIRWLLEDPRRTPR